MSHTATATVTKRRIKHDAELLNSAAPPAVRPAVSITRHALMVLPHPERDQLIAEAAYHRAEARGFVSGHELDDWLAAEAEVDARLYGERVS